MLRLERLVRLVQIDPDRIVVVLAVRGEADRHILPDRKAEQVVDVVIVRAPFQRRMQARDQQPLI